MQTWWLKAGKKNPNTPSALEAKKKKKKVDQATQNLPVYPTGTGGKNYAWIKKTLICILTVLKVEATVTDILNNNFLWGTVNSKIGFHV